jgi:hypothetical protein
MWIGWMDQNHQAFEQFLRDRRRNLQMIARHTDQEFSLEDVQGEAWVLAFEMEAERGVPISFADSSYQDLLCRFLYQKLVRYAETTVRYAVKLDHWAFGDDPDHDTHPLLNKLSAARGSDPLESLLAHEDRVDEIDPSPHQSRASAYIRLLQHCDNRMREVACHLLISLSYCYHRFNEAMALAQRQLVLPQALPLADEAFMPRPWRPFKIQREWVQAELDFVCETNLWLEH